MQHRVVQSNMCTYSHMYTYMYMYSSLSTLHVPVQAHVMCTLAILEGERLPLALSSSLKCFTYTRENRGVYGIHLLVYTILCTGLNVKSI